MHNTGMASHKLHHTLEGGAVTIRCTLHRGADKDRFDSTTVERNGKSCGATINDLGIDDCQIGLAAQDGKAFSRGLSLVQEDVVRSKLNPSWYFEGGRGNKEDDLSGI
jgi:hypothetical protein